MANGRLLTGLLVGAVVGAAVAWILVSPADTTDGLEWTPTPDGCVELSVTAEDAAFFIVKENDEGNWIMLTAKNSPQIVCGKFKVYRAASAYDCQTGECQPYESVPLPWPPPR